MSTTGRDPVDGWVYLRDPAIIKGGGPERVSTEDPPEGWTPPPFLGFSAPTEGPEPKLWDGDGA